MLLLLTGLGGGARVRTLQRWCAVLHELHPSNLPLLHCYTLHALSPSSPHHSSCDSDWQQLHFSGPEAAAPNAGLASANETPPVRPQKGSSPAASAPSGGGSRPGPVARGPELDFWANQVLYLDQESPDNERDLLTFRELFLHSYALENIIVGGYKALCTKHSVKALFTVELLHVCVCISGAAPSA